MVIFLMKVRNNYYNIIIYLIIVQKGLELYRKRIDALNNRLNEFESNNIKIEFMKFKDEYNKLSTIVKQNKDGLNNLSLKLNNALKNFKDDDENLKKKLDSLKKHVDNKVLELNTKLELFLNNIGGTDKNGESTLEKKFDLSALNDFMQKLITLENKFDDFVSTAKINYVYEQIKYLDEEKADKKELEKINNDNKGLKKKLEEKQNKCINDIDTINKMIEKINEQISSINTINIERERLKNNINSSIKEEEKEKKEINKGFGDGNVDASNKLSLDAESLDLYLTKYVLKSNYDDFLKVNKEKINKIRDEINKINNQIKEISNTLPNKADVDDLSELRDFLSNKFEELLTEIPKRFSDKNETTKFLKYLEDQIKTLMSISKSKNDSHMPENWLLAAKPISGFSCAACESYIGDLKTEKEKFIAWNKLPTRESGEKLYRMGNGFSKMLSMLNFDSNGNVYLNPNAESNNSEDEDESKCNTKRNKEKSLSTLLIRNKSQNDNLNLFNDHKINSNKLGKRTQNNFFKKEEIKSTYLPKIKKESDIAEIKKENDDNPKITKIFKKSHSKLHLKENN